MSTASPARLRNSQLTFLALGLLANVLASVAVHRAAGAERYRLVAFGAALDMTVTVTALYYWLIVRPGLRRKSSLVFVALMCLTRAAFALPDVIPGRALIGAGAEIALVAALAISFRRARRLSADRPDTDPVERIRAVLSGIVPFRTAERALAGEFSILYYLFAWRAKPHVPAGSRPFTLHKQSGVNDLFLMVGLLSLLEVGPVHLVIARWSVTGAWILTGLSLYGMLWAVALSRSFAMRPTLVSDRGILLRFGLLFSLWVPVESIRSISATPVPGAVPVPRNTSGNLFIEFTEPLEAEKMLGFTTRISAVAIRADDAQSFRDTLLELMPENTSRPLKSYCQTAVVEQE